MTEQEEMILDGVLRDEPFICVHDGYAYFLGPGAPNRLNWQEAMTWCKSLGDEYELPSKEILNECYQNESIRKEFDRHMPASLYWSSTVHEKYTDYSWFRNFGVGHLATSIHTNMFYVRSVYKIKI
jgi:hypothetical protein